MEVIVSAVIAYFAVGAIAEKYLEPWVNDKVEQYYEAKEQHMAWVLVALFIFNGEPLIMSDNILYENREKCNAAVSARTKYLEATRPKSMWEADYWVWCTQIPQEVQYG